MRVPALVLATVLPVMAAPQRADVEAVESLVIEGTNEFRASQNLSRLERNERLDRAARLFAQHLANGGAFAHESGGTTPQVRVFQAGYNACVIAENLAREYSSAGFATRELGQKLVQDWKNSPGHRRNMLERDALDTGVAVVHRSHDGVEDFYAVQLLARNESQEVGFKVRNRSRVAIAYRVDTKAYTLNPGWGREHNRCSAADLLFEGAARGHFETTKDACYVVQLDGTVKRESGECR